MKLLFLNGSRAGTTADLVPPGLCIGREVDNDVQLLIAGVSRYHARITFDGTNWLLCDLNSTNGTKVNNEMLTSERVLVPGDRIEIGDQLIEFSDKTEVSSGQINSPFVLVPPAREVPPVHAPDVTVLNTVPPATDAAVTSGKKTEGPELSGKNILEKLKAASGSGSVFGAKAPGNIGTSQDKQTGKKSSLFSGRMGNLIFALLVVMLALLAIWAFVAVRKADRDSGQPRDSASLREKVLPFVLYYERLQFTQDNIFRFSLKIEDKTALFMLDDLKYHRHFEKKIPQAENIELMKQCLRQNDFSSIRIRKPESSEGEKTDMRTLVVVLDRKNIRISVPGSSLSRSFERIEEGISSFADWNGIRIVVNVEETRKLAGNALKTAEQLFDNYKAKPENLRRAIAQYKTVIRYLDDMDPKPPEWKQATRKLEMAQTIMKQQKKVYKDAIIQCYELKQYREGAELCQKMMDLAGEADSSYNSYKDYKIAFEREYEKIRKGRK